jgi:hypothetical protein
MLSLPSLRGPLWRTFLIGVAIALSAAQPADASDPPPPWFTIQAQAPAPGGGVLRRGKDGKLEVVPETTAPAGPAAGEITLPEPLAVEMPPGATTLAPDASPLRELLQAARSGTFEVTHDLKQAIGIGPHRVTWTAWNGSAGTSAVRLQRTAVLFVLPAGQAPVGVSGSTHATAGNTSTKIVRDAAGRVHMAWLDARRGGMPPRVLYRRATTAPQTGAVTWETAAVRVNDGRSEAHNAFLGIAASAGAVHFVWQAKGSIRYRRLRQQGGAWVFDPIRDTSVRSDGHDVGPSLAAASDEEIHVVSPSGAYGVSKDGGDRWLRGTFPVPAGMRSKAATIAVDSGGHAHVAYTGVVRGPDNPSESRASDGYWELRYARRNPDGKWTDQHNALAGAPAWAAPTDGADVLVDWIRLAIDRSDNLHAVWHGTANTRIYGNDQPFYARRDATGPGAWRERWQPPVLLYQTDKARGENFAYAPAVAFDGDTVVAVTFYEVQDAGRTLGFDSLARIVRHGAVSGPPIPLTQSVRGAIASGRKDHALGTWFPSAAPDIFRPAGGQAWLDVLHTLEAAPVTGAPNLIVYQRVDLSAALARQR